MRNRLFVSVFLFFLRLFYRRDIGSVLYKPSEHELLHDTSLPVLILSNHVSWWDGFLLYFLSTALMPKRIFFIAMQKEEWEKRRWFSRLGVIPLDPSQQGPLLSFFKKIKSLKANSSHFCLSYFFEGKMAGPGENLGSPKRGTSLVIKQLAPVIILPVAITVDVRYRSKPLAFVQVGTPMRALAETEFTNLSAMIHSLQASTHRDTTHCQEHISKLYSMGWKRLW